jgi:superfamily II DNA or RNA helicase
MLRGHWPANATEISSLSSEDLQDWAAEAFGGDPRRRNEPFESVVIDVLRQQWFRQADASVVEGAVTLLELQLGPAPRARSARVAWVADRNKTRNLRWILTREFCKAHRTDLPVKSTVAHKEAAAHVRDLVGEAEPPDQLFPHQQQAHDALDAAFSADRRDALVVMPTGSGKTHTIVSWLLDRMAEDPGLRVLWLAHRRELIDQAAAAFEIAARSQDREFRRMLRAVHGGAAELITLADQKQPVDVAVATVQSFIAGGKSAPIVTSFFKRPVIVVMDEAHHVGAEQTDKFVGKLEKQDRLRMLIGLTATPYPTSIISQQRFAVHFPKTLFQVDAPPLIKERILARPITVVVDTARRYALSESAVKKLEQGLEPGDAFDVLDEPSRNRLIADLCLKHRPTHGPTLLFAVNIDHAETLVEVLSEGGVLASAVHSQSQFSMSDARKWFNSTTDPVLVSVGMLNEGVDLPMARTAFLARPTISRVLMKQMIGRVLRGPLAGGETDAYVVYLQDQFTNFSDLLDPAEVLDEYAPRRRHGLTDEPGEDLPVVVDDLGTKVPYRVVGHLGRMMTQPVFQSSVDDGEASNDRPFDVMLYPRSLVGYYELPTAAVPVLDHQKECWDKLVTAVLADESRIWQGFFDGEPPPAPPARSVAEMVEYVRMNGQAPVFVELEASLGPSRCADRILAAGSIAEDQRTKLIMDEWRGTVNVEAYPTADHFHEAVERELRDRRRAGRLHHSPPAPTGHKPTKRPKFLDIRPLKPLFEQVIVMGRELLPAELSVLLDNKSASVDWSPRKLWHLYGYWTIATHGRNRGRRRIIVSSLYRTEPKVVSDEMLRYLLWHELLHDLLPGQQHDAQFREMEYRWPGALELDAEWAGLHDRYLFPRDPQVHKSSAHAHVM